jgi:hypothetical protein
MVSIRIGLVIVLLTASLKLDLLLSAFLTESEGKKIKKL